jgi:hypothetical protein
MECLQTVRMRSSKLARKSVDKQLITEAFVTFCTIESGFVTSSFPRRGQPYHHDFCHLVRQRHHHGLLPHPPECIVQPSGL